MHCFVPQLRVRPWRMVHLRLLLKIHPHSLLQLLLHSLLFLLFRVLLALLLALLRLSRRELLTTGGNRSFFLKRNLDAWQQHLRRGIFEAPLGLCTTNPLRPLYQVGLLVVLCSLSTPFP